jgi:hypothetical protein
MSAIKAFRCVLLGNNKVCMHLAKVALTGTVSDMTPGVLSDFDRSLVFQMIYGLLARGAVSFRNLAEMQTKERMKRRQSHESGSSQAFSSPNAGIFRCNFALDFKYG